MKNYHCKHWHGSVNDVCKAGVNWQEVTGGPQLGIMRRCPCINTEHAAKCDLHALPTPEELAAEEAEWERILAQHVAERPHWEKIRRENPRGSSGVCKCPRCGGECQWSIAFTNGHMHVRCRTDDCIAFME